MMPMAIKPKPVLFDIVSPLSFYLSTKGIDEPSSDEEYNAERRGADEEQEEQGAYQKRKSDCLMHYLRPRVIIIIKYAINAMKTTELRMKRCNVSEYGPKTGVVVPT